MKYIVLAALAVNLQAQTGVRLQTTATTIGYVQGKPVVQPVQSGTVTVCQYSGGSCGPTTIYSDSAMAVPMAQPIVLDSSGNIGFYVPTGLYAYTVCPSNSTCQGPFMFSGNSTVSGVQSQPSADQFSSNVLYMAAYGNVPQRAMAAYAAANAQGKGLTIILSGGLAPATATDLVIPSGGFVNNFYCENGSGLQYNGNGNAVLLGTSAASGLPNTFRGCTIRVAMDSAISGISTCALNAGIFGVNIIDNFLVPLDYTKFTNSSTTNMIDLCGNVVAPYVHGNVSDRGLNGIILRASVGTFQSGSNGALLDHNTTENAIGHGVYITPTSGAQNVTVRNHLDEGGGCLLNNVASTGSSIDVEYSQGSSFVDNYLEAQNCGLARMVIGGAGGTVDALRVIGGVYQEGTNETDILLRAGTNITIDPFTRSGSSGANAVTIASTFSGYNIFLNMDTVSNLSTTFEPEMNSGLRFTTTRYNDMLTSGQLSFPQGSCTPIFRKSMGTNYWQIAASGEWTSPVGYLPVNAGKPVTSTNPTVSISAGPLITFSISNGNLCGTPASGTGTVQFHGTASVSGLTTAPSY